MRTHEEILRSLVADIEAMRAENMDERLEQDDPDGGSKAFGGFSVALDRSDVLELGVFVSWPNLAILLEEAKERLATPARPNGLTVVVQGGMVSSVVSDDMVGRAYSVVDYDTDGVDAADLQSVQQDTLDYSVDAAGVLLVVQAVVSSGVVEAAGKFAVLTRADG